MMKDVQRVSFAVDDTPYMSANNITNLFEDLEDSARSLLSGLQIINARECNKFHALLRTNEKTIAKSGSAEIKNSQPEKLLRVTIDIQLSFENHINNICCKAKAKLAVLSRVAPFINFSQKKNGNGCIFLRHNSTIAL